MKTVVFSVELWDKKPWVYFKNTDIDPDCPRELKVWLNEYGEVYFKHCNPYRVEWARLSYENIARNYIIKTVVRDKHEAYFSPYIEEDGVYFTHRDLPPITPPSVPPWLQNLSSKKV